MESNQLNSPKVFSHKGQGKSTHFQAQMKRVFAALYRQPKTMLMVSIETVILEIARKKINKPIVITSGYRTISHNEKVGGAKYSYHTRGMAADIRANGVTPKELAKVLNDIVPNNCGIIVYDKWAHFDTRNEKYRKGV